MEPNDILAQAIDTGLAGQGSFSISSSIINDDDVDVYEFFLDGGDLLFADIDADRIGSSLDPLRAPV